MQSYLFYSSLIDDEVLESPSLEEVRGLLKKFFFESYSANLMCLTVLGKGMKLMHSSFLEFDLMSVRVRVSVTETLDDLEEHVKTLFESIPNLNKAELAFTFNQHPWGPEQLKHRIYIALESDVQLLRLLFPTPDVFDQKFYLTAVS